MCNEFTTTSQAPIFGVQASWLCFCKNGCKQGVPDNADIAFLYLQTYRTKAEKLLEQLLDSGCKKVDALKKCNELEHGSQQLTRLQCPSLGFDEEGRFKDVFSMFIQLADKNATNLFGDEFESRESFVTTAWVGETRKIICRARNNMG